MDSIKSGSQEHLDTFANTKLKNYYENLWDQEITVLLATDKLRKTQEKKAKIEEKLERKEFSSANEGKKELQAVEQDIKALTNLIIRDTETIANHKSVIEKTQQWVKDNGQTEQIQA